MQVNHSKQSSRCKSALAAVMLSAVSLLAAAPSQAMTIIGVEDPVSGFVGSLLKGFPDYVQVASDGEASFRPFGVGPDVSDAIYFGPENMDTWMQAAESTWTDNGAGVWYLPAANPGPGCPPENATDVSLCHEAVGHWLTLSGPWNPTLVGDYAIMSEDGTVGDYIRLYNSNGAAHLTFASDPIGLPEPASLALVGAGLAGLLRKRRTQVA